MHPPSRTAGQWSHVIVLQWFSIAVRIQSPDDKHDRSVIGLDEQSTKSNAPIAWARRLWSTHCALPSRGAQRSICNKMRTTRAVGNEWRGSLICEARLPPAQYSITIAGCVAFSVNPRTCTMFGCGVKCLTRVRNLPGQRNHQIELFVELF